MTYLTGFLRLLYRLPWLILHILFGTPLTVLCQSKPGKAIRFGGRALSEIMIGWWARMICRIFGIRRLIKGEFQPGPQLVAANHISFLDIQLLHSLAAVGFVAKAEIATWPVVSWLARIGGTVFHERGSHNSSTGVSSAMTNRLQEGSKVAIFPEGGILPGSGVKYFHARMFAAAIETGTPVQPVMIRYIRDGDRYDDITFLPHEKTLDNFFRLLKQKPCVAEVQVLPLVSSVGKQRRQLAKEAENAVRAAYDSDLPRG